MGNVCFGTLSVNLAECVPARVGLDGKLRVILLVSPSTEVLIPDGSDPLSKLPVKMVEAARASEKGAIHENATIAQALIMPTPLCRAFAGFSSVRVIITDTNPPLTSFMQVQDRAAECGRRVPAPIRDEGCHR